VKDETPGFLLLLFLFFSFVYQLIDELASVCIVLCAAVEMSMLTEWAKKEEEGREEEGRKQRQDLCICLALFIANLTSVCIVCC